MKKQMTKIAMMLVLVIGLMAGAATAQIVADGGGFNPVGIYTGVETAKGTCEAVSMNCYGNTFVLDSFGESQTYHLTVSMNYLDIPNHNGSGIEVTGGSWSLVVYRDNAYAGTLYGEVQAGSMNLITDGKGQEVSKQVQVSFNSTGGLGALSGKEYENLSAVLSTTTDLRSNETQGSASFLF